MTQEFERRRPIATELAVLLTHQVPGRDQRVTKLLSTFLTLRFPDEPLVEPVFVLMNAFWRVRSTTKVHPLALALALVKTPDTWSLLSPEAILEWARFWSRRSWPRAKEFVSDTDDPALFHRLVRGEPFGLDDALAYADLAFACLDALSRGRDFNADELAAAEATFLASVSPEASARLQMFRHRKKRAPGRPGRPRHALTTMDARIVEAWRSGEFETYADLARELNTEDDPVTEDRVLHLVERDRQAKRRRTNPPSSP